MTMKKIKKILGWLIIAIFVIAFSMVVFHEYSYLGILIMYGCFCAGGLIALAVNWITS